VTLGAYGPGADRFGELWRPAGDGPWPVVVLLHGGFWRAQRGLELMRPLAADLAGRGFAGTWIDDPHVGRNLPLARHQSTGAAARRDRPPVAHGNMGR
jgi:hypothetical protein